MRVKKGEYPEYNDSKCTCNHLPNAPKKITNQTNPTQSGINQAKEERRAKRKKGKKVAGVYAGLGRLKPKEGEASAMAWFSEAKPRGRLGEEFQGAGWRKGSRQGGFCRT